MDGHTLRCAEAVLSIGVVVRTVRLQQIAARDVGRVGGDGVLLCDVDTMWPHVDLIAYLICAEVIAVELEVDKAAGGIEAEPQPLAEGRGQRVAHHRLVGGVGQQRPRARLRVALAEKLFLLPELDAVGLLGHVPGRVAAPAYLRRVVDRLVVLPVDVNYRAVFVRRLAGDVPAVGRRDAHQRQVGVAPRPQRRRRRDDDHGEKQGNDADVANGLHGAAIMLALSARHVSTGRIYSKFLISDASSAHQWQ